MKRAIVVVLWLCACGDSGGLAPGGAGGSGGTGGSGGATGVCGSDNFALVALTDYMAPGHAAKIKLDTFDISDNVFALGEDSALSRIGDTVWVMNEYGATSADNVQSFALPALTPLLLQTSIGAGNDPQDLLIGSDGKVYVCELEGPGIAVLANNALASPIDLSSLDPDGKPNCVALYRRGHLIYAFLALWDDTQMYKPPRGVGKVAVVDETTGQMVGSFDMMSPNPAGWVREEPNTSNVLIAATADFSGTGGGIERIDVDGRRSLGMVVTGAAIGNRYVSDFAIGKNGEAFVTAVDPASTEGQSNLLPFTMAGQVGQAMGSGSHSAGVAIDACNHLWVIDRGYGMGAPNGIYVYDAATKAPLHGPIMTSIPPRFWGGIVFIP
jgi:hypothetical protein